MFLLPLPSTIKVTKESADDVETPPRPTPVPRPSPKKKARPSPKAKSTQGIQTVECQQHSHLLGF